MLDDELDNALLALIKQWNIAEQRIKKAEQVRGNEVVASAIFELRYAGRKVIDAIELILTKDIQADEHTKGKVRAYIADATEDCVKAKHDAIDAMMDFVTSWFNQTEKKLTLRKVQLYFPDYLKTTSLIFDLQDKIAESRKDRNTLRDLIYNEIEKNGYDSILSLYDTMRKSRKRVAAEIRRENFERYALWAVTIISLVIAAAEFSYILFFKH